MSAREQLGLAAAALAILLSGAALGAAFAAATHRVEAPSPPIDAQAIDDGAIDFAAEKPVQP